MRILILEIEFHYREIVKGVDSMMIKIVFITHTVKRQKQNEQPLGIISTISSIYQMVIGKKKLIQPIHVLGMSPDKTDYVIVDDDNVDSKPTCTEPFMSPLLRTRHQSSVIKRTGLRQISNSTVLDLTTEIDDDDLQIHEESEVDDDLQLTSVKYDLTPKYKSSDDLQIHEESEVDDDLQVTSVKYDLTPKYKSSGKQIFWTNIKADNCKKGEYSSTCICYQ